MKLDITDGRKEKKINDEGTDGYKDRQTDRQEGR
jgi:hypothetical protein